MNLKRGLKSFLAVGAAVTMLLGTSLTALAAYDTVDDTTTPRVVTEADANVIATSDATQLYLTGSLTMVHDYYGSPDPVLVNNGDGSWVLIMYKGQTVALGVNNPYTAYTEYVPTITNILSEDELEYYNEDEGGWVDLDAASSENGGMYESIIAGYTPLYGYTDIYNNVVINGDKVGSYVYNLSVDHYYSNRDNYSVSEYGPETLSNTVTLAIYVLDKQAGAQNPTYTVDEKIAVDMNNDDSWKAAPETLRYAR